MAKPKPIQVRPSAELHAVIKEMADRRGMSMGAYCEQAAILQVNRDILNPYNNPAIVDYYKAAQRYGKRLAESGTPKDRPL